MNYGQIVLAGEDIGQFVRRADDHFYVLSAFEQLLDQQPSGRSAGPNDKGCHLLCVS